MHIESLHHLINAPRCYGNCEQGDKLCTMPSVCLRKVERGARSDVKVIRHQQLGYESGGVWPDTIAVPHGGIPALDAIAAMEREEAEAGMRMLAYVIVYAVGLAVIALGFKVWTVVA